MININLPLTCQLEITDKCNFMCIHCYHFGFSCPKLQQKSEDKNDEQIFYLAQKIVEAGIFSVVLTGGEPLVRKGLTFQLIKYFKSNNKILSLNTNLSLIDQRTLGIILQTQLDGMLISCPTTNPYVYKEMTGGADYNLFERKLKMIIESDQHFSVNMVVNQRNINLIRQTAIKLKSFGVEKIGATPMGLNVEYPQLDLLLDRQQVEKVINDLLWIKNDLNMDVDIFEAIPKCTFPIEVHKQNLNFLNRKCQAGRTTLSIANNGDLRPCTHNPKIYGNLFKESINSVWQKMGDWRSNDYIPVDCRKCKLLSKCLGGCRMTAKAFTQNVKGKDPWMSDPLSENILKRKSRPVILEPSMEIAPSKEFRWRKEGNNYLICTKTTRNIILVNEELFNFMVRLKKIVPIKLSALAQINQTEFNNMHFQKIIKLLVEKKFISLINR